MQKDKEEGETNQGDKASLDMGSSKAPGCGATHDQGTVVLRSSDDRLPHLYQKNARNLGARVQQSLTLHVHSVHTQEGEERGNLNLISRQQLA